MIKLRSDKNVTILTYSNNNLLIVSNDLKRGGKERQLYFLLKGLNEKFNVVLVLRRNNISFDIHQFDRLVIKISPYPKFLPFLLFLIKTISEYRPSIVHSWESVTTLCSIILKPFFYYKVINGEIRFARKIRRLSLEGILTAINTSLANINIANSKAGLSAFNLIRSEKNLVIYNGYDFTYLPCNIKKENAKRFEISMIANFNPQKDHKTLIDACISLMESGYDIACNLVGEGPLRCSIMRQIPLKFQNRFIFWGDRKDISEILKITDLGVLLSKKGHSEGMSNAIMEFMLCGIPVIATQTGGNVELISDRCSGFLIPFEDSFRLKSIVKELIGDKNLLTSIGKNAYKYSHENFGIERMVNEYINVYNYLSIS